ncbi:hypothetical protein JZ751_015350 [Albula glossodonta]|uniref:Uncharacterized protein n=1 Tax=Albula glossodonta TaxID=121402 RepID=A0A8T2MXC2_9TELE|nr:hypothetical protein JZ751_015350 [Albula glossodonta]
MVNEKDRRCLGRSGTSIHIKHFLQTVPWAAGNGTGAPRGARCQATRICSKNATRAARLGVNRRSVETREKRGEGGREGGRVGGGSAEVSGACGVESRQALSCGGVRRAIRCVWRGVAPGSVLWGGAQRYPVRVAWSHAGLIPSRCLS